ncbi:hypothetical protein HaLaN_31141, partial [Haematococcus lacustris]
MRSNSQVPMQQT